MSIVTPCYHWAPANVRDDIRRDGLVPYSRSPNPVWKSDEEGEVIVGWPYICLGALPLLAWSLSGDMPWSQEIDHWDLWSVHLVEGDEVHFMAEWGPHIKEIRVRNTIPADRVTYVATRTQPVAKEFGRA